jgi:predicted dehydrogenase
MNNPIRLGVLGCGTIVRDEHLPAILLHSGVRLVSLVDADETRAAKLARKTGLDCKISTDYRAILHDVDAVLNALPNHLHAPVTLEALTAGVHVLCEKPLAIKSADARACASAAAERRLVLAVGMSRRFHDSHQLLKMVLDQGLLGTLEDYDWQMGGPLDWRAASNFYFSKEQAGGGVLIDHGVHLLDSLVDWFGPVTDFKYEDDDWGGGIEANARLSLQHSGPYGGVSGHVRLSRTYTLQNRLLVRGREAHAELRPENPEAVILHRQLSGERITDTLARAENGQRASSVFYRQLENFVRSIHGEETPLVDGRQAASVLELIERCYARRERLPEPWSEVEATFGVPQ